MTIGELEKRLRKNSGNLKKSMNVPENSVEFIKDGEEGTMKKTRKSVILSMAGAAAAAVLVVNCVPGVAHAGSKLPVIGSIIRVVTFGRYEVKEKGYEANIVTPQIEGLLNKELEEKLNNEFEENAHAIISAFEQDIKELEQEFGDDFRLGVDANYTVRTDNDDILAIDTYIVDTVASSSTKHSFYNIDKKTGKLIEPEGLFKEGVDYITPISGYIIEEMQKANDNGTGSFWIGSEGDFEGFEKIKPDQNFFINEEGNIVICFDKYEVAIGAAGCPEFEIPESIVKDILK